MCNILEGPMEGKNSRKWRAALSAQAEARIFTFSGVALRFAPMAEAQKDVY